MSNEPLIISAPLPPPSNRLYPQGRDGQRYLGEQGKEYKRHIKQTMMRTSSNSKCPEPPFSLHLHLRFPDRHKRDIGNIQDITKASTFEWLGYAQSLIYDEHTWCYLDKANPSLTIEIRHCDRVLGEHDQEH